MKKRPLSVLIIGCLFIAAGVLGFVYHMTEWKSQAPFEGELVWVLTVRLLAIVGGAFLLRGANWARWLLLVWVGYHVILSAWHPVHELILHSALLAGVAYVLLRPQTSYYFRSAKPTT